MIKIPYSVTYIGYDAFYNTAWYNNQPNGILYLDGWCLGYKEEEPTGSLTIQEGTKGIANGGFEDCSGLTSVTIPNSTTTIGNRTFFGCTGLRSISIPNSVKNIGDETFTGCEYLDQISVKKILKINKNVVFEW